MAAAKKKDKAALEPVYTREALANSKKFRPWCDVLMVVLDSNREYTIHEAEAEIEKFKNNKIVEKVNRKDDK